VSGRPRPLAVALIVLALVVAFTAGTVVASGSPAHTPAALGSGQQAALQTSNWLMTTQVYDIIFVPIIVRNY
jgi:hypothetical protein